MEWVRGVRSDGLQPGMDFMGLRECPQMVLVLLGQRQQVPEHQDGGVVGDRDLDLRQPFLDGQLADELAQGNEKRAHRRRQHLAFVHLGDVGRAPLAETHHRAARRQITHREARAVAIAPFRAVGDGQHGFRRDLADALEAVLQPALLGRHLRALVGVLRGAAAADTEVRAARRAPAGGGLENRAGAADLELGLLLENPDRRAFPGQGAFDEHDLALRVARHPAALGIEGVDAENQVFQSERNSCQCGSVRFSSEARSRLHSCA
jgi:hypothetical protein